VLTIADIRNGDPTACTLLLGGVSPAAISPAEKPVLVAPAEASNEAGELLDELLIALLEVPGDAWPELAAALPDELYDRIDRYLEAHLWEGA